MRLGLSKAKVPKLKTAPSPSLGLTQMALCPNLKKGWSPGPKVSTETVRSSPGSARAVLPAPAMSVTRQTTATQARRKGIIEKLSRDELDLEGARPELAGQQQPPRAGHRGDAVEHVGP